MNKTDITVDQLLSEWDRIRLEQNGKHEGMTTEEIMDATGMGYSKTLGLLKKGVVEGKIQAKQEMRTNLMRPGWRYRANVYVPVKDAT